MQKFANAKDSIMKKFKLTSARKAILEKLEQSQDHYTAIQIHDQLKERLPSLNLTTVYRSLDYLVDHGLISIADIGTGSPVYEKLNDPPHHHLVCLNCNKIEDINHTPVENFFKKIENDCRFTVKTNHLVLYGTCIDCQ